jgi:hypothetical protein
VLYTWGIYLSSLLSHVLHAAANGRASHGLLTNPVHNTWRDIAHSPLTVKATLPHIRRWKIRTHTFHYPGTIKSLKDTPFTSRKKNLAYLNPKMLNQLINSTVYNPCLHNLQLLLRCITTELLTRMPWTRSFYTSVHTDIY